jgi:hypothetical protein
MLRISSSGESRTIDLRHFRYLSWVGNTASRYHFYIILGFLFDFAEAGFSGTNAGFLEVVAQESRRERKR